MQDQRGEVGASWVGHHFGQVATYIRWSRSLQARDWWWGAQVAVPLLEDIEGDLATDRSRLGPGDLIPRPPGFEGIEYHEP